jgi:peptide/nickel transport system substrate-binding protein
MTLEMTRRCLRPLLVAAALLLAAAAPASAQTLRVGLASEPSSIDPHFSRTGNNQNVAEHIFDRLVIFDENLQVKPGLALAWRATDPLTWEIRLRPDVLFSDGTPFTAADVIYSLERARDYKGSPAPFTGAVSQVAGLAAADPLTLIVKTRAPAPQLIQQLGIVFIISKAAAEGRTSDEFRRGAAIGTGAYRLAEWKPGERIGLTANERHWGAKPAFPRAELRFLVNAGARIAALLAGEVDIIDQAPTNDIEAITARGFKVATAESARIVYLALDAARDTSPFITDPTGRPLSSNPLKDQRVRRALSKLIDRQTIVTRLLRGAGTPAGQMVPAGLGGYDEALVPEAFDPAGARALLAEAGLAGGFGLTVHTSTDRFPADRELGQAIAQYFARGGLAVRVEGKAYAVYAAEATRRLYSAFVFSFGSSTPDAAGALLNVLATHSSETGRGAFNRTRYANSAFDAALDRALQEFDPAKRDGLLRDAQALAMRDVALIPLYFQKLHWAMRRDLAYTPGKDEAMHAFRVRPAP